MTETQETLVDELQQHTRSYPELLERLVGVCRRYDLARKTSQEQKPLRH